MDTIGAFIFELIFTFGTCGICFVAGVAWQLKKQEEEKKNNENC